MPAVKVDDKLTKFRCGKTGKGGWRHTPGGRKAHLVSNVESNPQYCTGAMALSCNPFGKWWQENQKFKTILGCKACSRPIWAA